MSHGKKFITQLIPQFSLGIDPVNDFKVAFDGVEKFSSKNTLDKYNLGTQGNIKRIKSALENKEIIDRWGPKIEYVDPLFKIWFGKVFY